LSGKGILFLFAMREDMGSKSVITRSYLEASNDLMSFKNLGKFRFKVVLRYWTFPLYVEKVSPDKHYMV
jgi:hypothetical protein